jgi:hypothetical protein
VVGRHCPEPEPTLADLLVGALRRHGRAASDGTVRASAREGSSPNEWCTRLRSSHQPE